MIIFQERSDWKKKSNIILKRTFNQMYDLSVIRYEVWIFQNQKRKPFSDIMLLVEHWTLPVKIILQIIIFPILDMEFQLKFLQFLIYKWFGKNATTGNLSRKGTKFLLICISWEPLILWNNWWKLLLSWMK